MPLSLTRTLIPRAFAALGVAAVCIICGWAITQHSKLAMIPVGIVVGIAIVLVIAQLGVTALLLWPPLGVIAYPLSRHLPGSPYVTFDRLWIFGLLILCISLPKAVRHDRASKRMLTALALLTAVIGIRTFFTSASSLYPERVWIDSLVLPMILFIVVRRVVIVTPNALEKIAFSLTITCLMLGLVGIGEQLFGFELATLSGSTVRVDTVVDVIRLSGPYDVPEVYGLTLLLCIGASMYWTIMRPRPPLVRAAGFSVVGIGLLASFFTFFRVDWISAVILVFVILGLRPGRYGRALAIVAFTLPILVFGFIELEQIRVVSERVTNTSNIENRLATYEQGFQMFEAHPWFGVGATRYADVSILLPTVYVGGQPSVASPHSSFNNTLVEDGIFGFIALLLAVRAIVLLIHALNRERDSEPDTLLAAMLVGTTIAYLLYSLSLTMIPYAPCNEILAILLGLGAGRLDQRLIKPPRDEAPVEAVPPPPVPVAALR
jgi:hypothetical protein